MNKFSSMFGQVLQIFSKKEFYSAVKETKAEKEQKDFHVGVSLLPCSSVSWVMLTHYGRSAEDLQVVWASLGISA
jgi:hypothetical protein